MNKEIPSINIKLFGILRERMKSNNLAITIKDNSILLKDLKKYLRELYPALNVDDVDFVFAVNRVITNEDVTISSKDEIALIPPVSGG
ncbi:MAG: MoaD/ThiS family protein [Nitrososphaeraceae archaeon]|nr:MoaD/ThiS family protein [Nitrososphaeraceae archaeon]